MVGCKLKLSAIGCLLALTGCATGPYHIEPYRDVSCLGHAAIPLSDAITAAETSLGQKVVDAEYNIDNEMACIEGDPGHYDITFYDNGGLKRATVDAGSGKVGPGHKESLVHRLIELDILSDWPESEMLKGGRAAVGAQTTAHEAVRLAAATGGQALAVNVRTESQKTMYVVEVVKVGHISLVSVDPQNGTVRETTDRS